METKTSKIRSWLYGAETRISLEQLTLDFGEFPPAPLQVVTSPNSKFKILHITNTPRKALYVLSNIKYVISLLPEFFKSAEFIQHKSTIKPQITQIVIAHRETVTELFSSFRKEIGICKTENKRLKLLLLYLLRVTVTGLLLFFFSIYLPLLAIFFTTILAISLLKLAKIITLRSLINRETHGSASLLPDSPDELKVFKANDRHALEATISHEHIHFLQKQHLIKTKTLFESSRTPLNNIANHLSESISQEIKTDSHLEKHLNYLLERVEVEARLHEMLVAYYLHNKSMPSNAYEFIEALILSSDGIKNILAMHLSKDLDKLLDHIKNETFTSEMKEEFNAATSKSELLRTFSKYYSNKQNNLDEENIFSDKTKIKQRDPYAEKDLYYLATYICDTNPSFIFEVLPVLYANLLSYYGDEELSNKIKDEVPKSKYYHQLYPESDNAGQLVEHLVAVK